MKRGIIALLVLLAACSSDDPFAKLPTPEVVDVASTTTTSEPDLTVVPLAPVLGSTTTSVALGPGPMTIVGRIDGPDGSSVAGAVVQLERVVGDGSASTRVPTAPDGTWNLENVLGGRYRIRAWKAPDLVSRTQVIFIESAPQRVVEVALEEVGGIRVDAAVAPDPPIVDEQVNLKVRVAERSVDRDGLVTDVPVSRVSVTLEGSGDWDVDSSNPSTTGSDGSAIFRLTCERAGTQPLFAALSGGDSYALSISACVDPTSTATTSSTSSSTTSTTTSTTEA
jgi:hypothetical protein